MSLFQTNSLFHEIHFLLRVQVWNVQECWVNFKLFSILFSVYPPNTDFPEISLFHRGEARLPLNTCGYHLHSSYSKIFFILWSFLCVLFPEGTPSTRMSVYHLGFRTQCYLLYASALFPSDRFNSYSHILAVRKRGSSYRPYGTFLTLARFLPGEFN